MFTADFIIIDLAGFSITATGRSGLYSSVTAIAARKDTNGIIVQNGSIFGFGTGVDLDGGCSFVEGLRLSAKGGSFVGLVANGIVRTI